MIELQTSLRHMAWADDKFFAAVSGLPEDRLAYTNGDPDWPIARGLVHILQGVQWYRFLLLGAQWSELKTPTNTAEVADLRRRLAELNSSLIEAANEPDAVIEFEDEGGPRKALRSVVLAQAPYHAAEHRSQMVAALHANGERSIHLDDYDVWAWFYETQSAQG